jgi:hypothetical protein
MIDVYPSTYSAADLPSRLRAAPAKKRRLSTENGISSTAIAEGLPTFRDSSCQSSSAFSSMTLARASKSSIRSFGVFVCHSSHALRAASTARSTSASEPFGTSAMTSPVAGLSTSIVWPSSASTHSPPMRFLCFATVTAISRPPRLCPNPTPHLTTFAHARCQRAYGTQSVRPP